MASTEKMPAAEQAEEEPSVNIPLPRKSFAYARRGTVANPNMSTVRKCYSMRLAEGIYAPKQEKKKSLKESLKDTFRCSRECVLRVFLGFFPIIKTLINYSCRNQFIKDMMGGLSVGFLHLPQGLGFGLLASLEPIHGLYSSFFPVLVYMVFGTSPHVSMGTNAVVALLAADIVDGENKHWLKEVSMDPNVNITKELIMEHKVGTAGLACLIAGCTLILMGLLRMGFVTCFMSNSFIGGFSFAAAVHIVFSQLSKLMNIDLPLHSGLGKLVFGSIDIVKQIEETNIADVIVGVVVGIVLLGVNIGINERYKSKLKFPVPIELIVVVLSTIISHYAEFEANLGVDVVGNIPSGMATFTVPPLEAFSRIVQRSCITAILIFALTISLGKLTAKIHDIDLDDNQELIAYGMCQVVGAFFQNFPSSISPPRTMMLSGLGIKSTLHNISSALFVLLVLLVLGPLFVSLPIPMLSAMIIVAMKDILKQLTNLKRLWHVNKNDFFIWLVTALVSIFGDLDYGLAAGLTFSMMTVLNVSMTAEGMLYGKAAKEDMVLELNRDGIVPVPGVKIFRFDAALHFASADQFKSQLYTMIFNPTLPKYKDRCEFRLDFSSGSGSGSGTRLLMGSYTRSLDKLVTKKPMYQPKVESMDETGNALKGQDPEPGAPRKARKNQEKPSKAEQITVELAHSQLLVPPEPARSQPLGPAEPPEQSDQKETIGTVHSNVDTGQIQPAASEHKVSFNAGREQQPILKKTVQLFSDATDPAVTQKPSEEEDWEDEGSGDWEMMQANEDEVYFIILDCSAMTYIDLTGIDMLHLIIMQYTRAGVTIVMSDVPPKTMDILRRADFFQIRRKQKVYFSVLDALHAIRPILWANYSRRHTIARPNVDRI